MSRIFSPAFKFGTWRRLWIALAEAERELGLPIAEEAIEAMRRHRDEIDLERAAELERRLRHDVMAHVHLYGEIAPEARGVIHLGATSAFVTDNTELIQHRAALVLVRDRLVSVIGELAEFARRWRDLPRSDTRISSRHSRRQSGRGLPSGSRICYSTSRRSSSDSSRSGSAVCAARLVPRRASSNSSMATIPRSRR